MNFPDLQIDYTKLIASLAGSFVSLKFVPGDTLKERAMVFFGGSAVSWYSSDAISKWIGNNNIDGLVHFWVGILGMTIVSKLYEVVQAQDPNKIAEAIVAWWKRKWGA